MIFLLNWLAQIVFYLVAIPILVGLLCWPSLTRPLRVVWFSQVVGLLITLANDFVFTHKADNYSIYYASTALDAMLMTLFFMSYLPNRLGQVTWALCGGLLLYMAWGITQQGQSVSSVYFYSSLESCFVVLMALVVGYRILEQSVAVSLRREPMAWVVVGLLLMNLITLTMNLFSSQMVNYSAELFNLIVNTFSPLSNLGIYVFISIGFWLTRSQSIRHA